MHRVPDGELLLEHDNGNSTIVSFGDRGQMSPCELRVLLQPTDGRFGSSISGLHVGGCFEALGGSVFVRTHARRNEGWFVTTLDPVAAKAALSECDLPISGDEDLAVHLVSDSVLGLTVGSLRFGSPAFDALAGEVALRMQATCTAEQVIGTVQGERTSGGAA